MFTREQIESLPVRERPHVAVSAVRIDVDKDGRESRRMMHTEGRILVDGGEAWIEIWAAGSWHAERADWTAVVSAANDQFAAPIQLAAEFEYEI